MATISLAQQAIRIAPQTAHLWTTFKGQTNSFVPLDSKGHRKGMANPECSMTESQGGRILRKVLSNEGRTKMNVASDRGFYSFPRLVTHVDDQFLSSLTNLYRERIAEDAEVLDLMSSWVSHLPGTIAPPRSLTLRETLIY